MQIRSINLYINLTIIYKNFSIYENIQINVEIEENNDEITKYTKKSVVISQESPRKLNDEMNGIKAVNPLIKFHSNSYSKILFEKISQYFKK